MVSFLQAFSLVNQRLPSLRVPLRWPAFGDELVGLELCGDSFDPWLASPTYKQWRTPGGRAFAAAYLLPLAERELSLELRRLSDAAAKAAATSQPPSSRAPRAQ